MYNKIPGAYRNSAGVVYGHKEAEMKRVFYGTQEAAFMLGISKQTLLRYEKKKIFPRPKRNPINRRREFSIDEITKLKQILGRV
jgi:DNA-binding XRE family transcriptional regulator